MDEKPARTWWEYALDLIGVHHPSDRGWILRVRPRFFLLLGIGALLFLVSLLGVARYSESPRFCRSCHIMEPYYKAWSASKHSGVACVECHYPPASPRTILWKKFQALSQVAKYVTRTYSSKPYAEVDDSSCLRCHSTRLLEGRLTTRSGVFFDHRPHLAQKRRGRQLRCVSCHSQVVVGRHIEVTYETCYLCHFKGRGEGRNFKPLGGCTGCHQLPAKTFQIANMRFNHKDFVTQRGLSCQNCHLDVVSGKGDVPQDRCLTCHNQPEKLARFGDVAFIHDNHVTKHHAACFHCHEVIRHGLNMDRAAPLEKPGEPPTAATGTTAGRFLALAFDCVFCHQKMHSGQLEMYSGKTAKLGLPEMPSPMYLANVDCVGCHYQEKPDSVKEYHGKTYRASQAACVKCHGPKFQGIWEDAKSELAKTAAEIAAKETAVAKALEISESTGQPRRKLRAELNQAAHLRRFVQAARGEHNIYLASLALRRADEALSVIGERVKAELPDTSGLPLLSGAFCAVMCHQRVGVHVPPETVQAFGKTMPHKTHAEILGCVKCHEIGTHKKVPLRKGIQETCRTCHP